MGQQFLQKSQSLVQQAAGWADELIRYECRCPGDLENARKRVARRLRVTESVLWRLRYRKPKDVGASTYFKLRSAYRDACTRQIEKAKRNVSLLDTMEAQTPVDELRAAYMREAD